MRRSRNHRRFASRQAAKRSPRAHRARAHCLPHLPRPIRADRTSLLLGTALASTFLIGSLTAPTPASAINCTGFGPGVPIAINTAIDSINCLNFLPRAGLGVDAIALKTTSDDLSIKLTNTITGVLFATGVNAYGIDTDTTGTRSPIIINNSGAIATADFLSAGGISARTERHDSPISITNSGPVATAGVSADGIFAISAGSINNNSGITLVNSGPIATAGDFSTSLGAQTEGSASLIIFVNSGPVATLGIYSAGIVVGAGGTGSNISFVNSGPVATAGFKSIGIDVGGGGNSTVSVTNSGPITTLGYSAAALLVRTFDPGSSISVNNSGDISTLGFRSIGILAGSGDAATNVSIVNSGNIATAGLRAHGILGYTALENSPVSIINSGDLILAGLQTSGIQAKTYGAGSPINITNSGFIDPDIGIYAYTKAANSPVAIDNSNRIDANLVGIFAATSGANSAVGIVNSGDVSSGGRGVLAYSGGSNSPIRTENTGDIVSQDTGMKTGSYGPQSGITLINTGDITSEGDSIYARTVGVGSKVSVLNSGDLDASHGPHTTGDGIYVQTLLADSPVDIVNQGNVTGEDDGIDAETYGANSSITITNSGTIDPHVGVYTLALGNSSRNLIINSGSIHGRDAAILAVSYTGTKIVNTGDISAGTQFAIGVAGASAEIYNAGHITGFVDLSNQADTFINQKGGVFETKFTSYFNGGADLFRNEEGGTVLAGTDPKNSEHSSFQGLERFENQGLITMEDGHAGDSFEISNTVGGRDLKFIGSGNSTLGVDAFLGGPGSISDIFTINGDVSGGTAVKVANTNLGPGVFNKVGIPVVYVNGKVKGDEFFLNQPIDTGFFDYDLFFKPTGSGVFELKSFLGPGAFVLPQLITAAQDMWHSGSDTWFDRTTDLRVLLNGGAAPTAYDPGAKYEEGAPAGGNITPAVWVRGAGNRLDRDVSANVTAYGRDYRFNLNRDLETIDFQGGIDLGKRGLFSDNDILVFGALGGFVHSDLDYDAINRSFDFDGGQVGGYATYLRGGLFVDTLLNVHLLELETRTLGFPNSSNITNVGLRTDTGYRFGSFGHGAFIEPLATISINWADIDGFSIGGNKVSFNDDPNVRGRLGLRVGTSMQVWTGTSMEPFVIGSLWGNLSDNNQATLVSTGTTFILRDDLQDVWGEVSAGVNFFNPSANTSVFAKLDVTFGDNVDGVGGKAGMRVSW
jgi:autotransporter family porin